MIMSYPYFKDDINKIIRKIYKGKKINILDVGAGSGLYGAMLKDISKRIDAVEIHNPYIKAFHLNEIYDNVYNVDICKFNLPIKYDLIIFGDVLEHIDYIEAKKLLDSLKDIDQIIIAVPYLYKQGIIRNNIYEIHKQEDLTKEIFLKRYPDYSYLLGNSEYGYFVKNKSMIDFIDKGEIMKPTLHMIGLFHTIPNHEFDHCAFTGKVLRFAKMMRMQGYEVIEYSNGESLSEANKHIQILTREELFKHTSTDTVRGQIPWIGSDFWRNFHTILIEKLRLNVKDGDIICHPFGYSHSELVTIFPNQFHVETGIGYPQGDFGAFRIFESYAWMHYHQGKHIQYDQNKKPLTTQDGEVISGRFGKDYEWVVPNYYDLNDWEPNYEKGKYLLYFGRVIEEKGLYIIQEIAKHMGVNEPIRIVGLGDLDKFKGPNMQIEGPIVGVKERSDLLRNARAVLMPTRFVEPFGGVAVEAMLCGTPVIASDFGAFTETLEHGKTGFRCHTLGDYLAAINAAESLDRKYIADRARSLYSLEAVGKKYDAVFKQIYDLKSKGWYTEDSHYIK
jgi:glycosyltransferase involved in cell wall biosynthesis